MASTRRIRKQAKFENDRAYFVWFERLKSLATCRREWVNLPDTMNEEMIENTLFYKSSFVTFQEPDVGLISLPYTQSNLLNLYGYPTEVRPYSNYVGLNYPYMKLKDVVITFGNRTRTPDILFCMYYAARLADIQRTADINLFLMKMAGGGMVNSEEEKDQIMQAVTQISENSPFLAVMKKGALGGEPFKEIGFKAEYLGNEFNTSKTALLSEFLTYMGFENAVSDKKERMFTAEVNGLVGATEAGRNNCLIAPQYGADQINRKWGTNIEVRFRSGIDTLLNRAFDDALAEDAMEAGDEDVE